MVKIAVAGGSGHLAREIIDVLLATKKHEILILSRKDPAASENIPGVIWVKTDYGDKNQLAIILDGVHTVLSFLVAHADPGSVTQKTLVDAAVLAGVKRFAPSEWSSSSIEELPWYAEKANMRAYLEEINKEKKVIEYTLFQTGLIVDYWAPLGSTTKYFSVGELWIDLHKLRALVLKDRDSIFTLTSLNDICNVVARAIEYEGEWPVTGGIKGTTISGSKVLEIGAKVRGKPFDITILKEEDVRAGNIYSPWIPSVAHLGIPPEQAEYFAKLIVTGSLLSAVCGSWVVSDEWNRLLPDYKFTGAEEFLSKVWAGKELE